jgi:hypothetical protein
MLTLALIYRKQNIVENTTYFHQKHAIMPVTAPTEPVSASLSHHHEKLMEAYEVHMRKWEALVRPGEAREHGRCPVCWLRTYDCYCTREKDALELRRQLYKDFNTVWKHVLS